MTADRTTAETQIASRLFSFNDTEKDNRMFEYEIGVIVGSLRAGSFNGQMAEAVARLAPAHVGFKRIPIDSLPLYNQDDDVSQAIAVKQLKAAVKICSGIVFVTPEYNRSIPGVLKNAIDHVSRPYGDNTWAGKPVAVMGVSIGAAGTSMAQQHLRNVLAYLDMPTLGQPEMFLEAKEGLFDDEGNIGEQSHDFVVAWMASFVGWVERHSTWHRS